MRPDVRSFWIALSKLKLVITLLITVIIAGTLSFYFFYSSRYDSNFVDGRLEQAFTAALTLLLGQDPILTYPHEGSLIIKATFLGLPLAGMVVIGLGLIEFGVVIFARSTRIVLWNEWKAKRMKGHTVLIGLGNVGRRLLRELRILEIEVAVITREQEVLDEQTRSLVEEPAVSLMYGDATETTLLLKANIEKARAILVATNDDLVNLKIASKAKKLNPNLRTIVRTFDQDFASQISQLLDIDAAYSTSAIAAPAFVAASFEDGIIQTLYQKEIQKRYHLAEIEFTSNAPEVSVGELENRYPITIIAINNAVHPQEEDIVKGSDRVLLLAELKVIRALKNEYCRRC
ncbi:MAG: potassium channel family protein [Candidatus Odinarchaeota archaeon]